MAETCPYTETCLIYKNWVEQINDKRLDIILKYNGNYECLAKIALEDPASEGGIPPNKIIEDRLQNLLSRCSHITLLNFLNKIKE